MTVALPREWVDVTPQGRQAGADHIDRLFASASNATSRLLVVSDGCIECAQAASATPTGPAALAPTGARNLSRLSPTVVAFDTDGQREKV